jgi:hypothetical protein
MKKLSTPKGYAPLLLELSDQALMMVADSSASRTFCLS